MRSDLSVGRRVARGALAGAGGAVALAPTDVLTRWALGRPPAFALAPVTRRLAARLLGHQPSHRLVANGQWMLRLTYGMTLGAALAAAGLEGARAAGLLAGLEMLAMPAAGATPPVRQWSAAERGLLLLHTAVFVAATRGILRLLRQRLATSNP